MNYWLFKSEPDVFSIYDLQNTSGQVTCWDGVRNYQARNFLRDAIKIGDRVLFYHSNSDPLAVAGTCSVIREAYADSTALDPQNAHFDPKSTPENPIWYMVDIKLESIFNKPVTLEMLRSQPALANLQLLRRGNRLSVMPVTKVEFLKITEMGE